MSQWTQWDNDSMSDSAEGVGISMWRPNLQISDTAPGISLSPCGRIEPNYGSHTPSASPQDSSPVLPSGPAEGWDLLHSCYQADPTPQRQAELRRHTESDSEVVRNADPPPPPPRRQSDAQKEVSE